MEILHAITDGRYKSGQRLPSEAQLVRQYKASRPTVARALAELQHEGYVERRAGSGTYVRAAKPSEGYLFGLILPKLGETEIFDPICREIVQCAHQGKHAVIWSAAEIAGESEQELEEACKRFVERRVEGIFLAPMEVDENAEKINQRLVGTLAKLKISVVLLDRDFFQYPKRSHYDLVGIDNRRAGYIATRHLLELGCRKVAFLHRPRSAETVYSRILGFRDAQIEAGNKFLADLICETSPSDEEVVRNLITRDGADAFVCANDMTAAILMHTLDSIGLRVPDDIRIVGIDDVRYASVLRVPLTTVHQPCQDIGRSAVKAMLERIANPHMPPRDILHQCRLVIRKSCGAGREAVRDSNPE